jgi:hypothetical protein
MDGIKESTRKTDPIFKIDFWSCYDRVIFDIPRSTNAVEGWHRALNNSTSVPHINIAELIEIIRNVVEKVRVDLLQVQSGNTMLLSERNFKKEEKLRAVVKSYRIYNP